MAEKPTYEALEKRIKGLEKEASELKRAKEALKESEQKYRHLTESLLDTVYEFDREGRFTYVNKAGTHMFGYSKEETLNGLRVQDTMVEEVQDLSERAISEIFKGNTTIGERTFLRKDGTQFIGEIHSGPIYKGAEVVGVRGVLRDITTSKQAEEALQKSEARYRSVFESTGNATVLIEEDMIISSANTEFEKLSGYSREEIEGKKKWTEFVDMEDLKRMKGYHATRRSNESEAPTEYEFHFIDRQGNVKHIFNKIGVIPGTKRSVASLMDITSRKHAEEALKESEGKLSAMLQSIGDHVSMMDKDLNIIWANEVAKKVFGNGIIGKKCYEAYHRRKEPCEPYPCLTLKAFQDEKVHEHDTKVIDKDGKIIYFHCTANVVLRDKEGKPTAVIEISRDITKRQQAEEEKKKLEAQLHHVQKMESLGRLAGGMAHNFRNILQAIMGDSQYLKMAYSQDKQLQEITRLIDESGKKGSDFIDSLLKFSRQEVEIDMLPLDLKDVLDETHKIISNTLDMKIKIVTNIEGPLPIKGDYSNLNQVFMNLCNNAGDSMPDGGVLTIEARRNKQEVIVTISDTGCGMNEETLENIFEPFYTTKEVGAGTGLGLSITYGIIEEHHGTISVSSQPGKGTVFKVSFPIAEEFD